MAGIGKPVVVVLIAGLALAGCKKGEVYDRSLDEAHTVLKATEVPLHYFGPNSDTDFSVSAPDPNTIVWNVTSDGAHVLTYRAVLAPEGDHRTRVTLTMEGSTAGKFNKVAGQMEKYPAIRNLYVATMTEATDSALEARPFDTTRFYPQIAAASITAVRMSQEPKKRNSSTN
jgi:hypothetical protein